MDNLYDFIIFIKVIEMIFFVVFNKVEILEQLGFWYVFRVFEGFYYFLQIYYVLYLEVFYFLFLEFIVTFNIYVIKYMIRVGYFIFN